MIDQNPPPLPQMARRALHSIDTLLNERHANRTPAAEPIRLSAGTFNLICFVLEQIAAQDADR